MNEQVLIKAIQSMSQEISQSAIDRHLLKAELQEAREENEKLKQELEKLKKESE